MLEKMILKRKFFIFLLSAVFAKDDLIKSAKNQKVITIENHSIIGGIGSLFEKPYLKTIPCSVLRIGTNDVFGQSGEQRGFCAYGALWPYSRRLS